jgi:glycosyltransferase involved in cell wall biosynthesis
MQKLGLARILPQKELTSQRLETEINNFKMKLSLGNKYKKEFIITDNLSYKDIIGLHNACDCFVAPSYGEAFCRPAAEALVLGKTPIVNQNTGMKDYINDSNGFLVKSHKVPVIVNDRPLSKNFDIYNASEYWYKPDIYDMIDKLRLVYNMNKNKDKELTNKQNNGMSSVNNFSYTNIGKNLCI